MDGGTGNDKPDVKGGDNVWGRGDLDEAMKCDSEEVAIEPEQLHGKCWSQVVWSKASVYLPMFPSLQNFK